MNEDKVKDAFRTLRTEAPDEWEENMYHKCCPSEWGLVEESCSQNCEKCWAAAIA